MINFHFFLYKLMQANILIIWLIDYKKSKNFYRNLFFFLIIIKWSKYKDFSKHVVNFCEFSFFKK